MLSLFSKIKQVLGLEKPPVAPAATAPYKVEPQPPIVEPVPVVEPTPVPTPAPEPKLTVVETPQPTPVPTPAPAAPVAEKPKAKRARTSGKFKADDKLTVEVNEAWNGGKAPAKKAKAPKAKTEKTKLKVVKTEPEKKKATNKK